jgi:hypothetical protein
LAPATRRDDSVRIECAILSGPFVHRASRIENVTVGSKPRIGCVRDWMRRVYVAINNIVDITNLRDAGNSDNRCTR